MEKIKIHEVYTTLSEEQKINFWSSAINIFLVVFTFWLGLTIQYIIVDSNAKFNNKLVRMEYYDKISEDYKKFAYNANEVKSFALNLGLDDEANISEYAFLKNSSYLKKENILEITNNIDSVISSANNMQWIIPENKLVKDFRGNLLTIYFYNEVIKICLNNPDILNDTEHIKNIFHSDTFNKITNKYLYKTSTTNDIIRDITGNITKILKENDTSKNRIYSMIIVLIVKCIDNTSLIIEDEIGGNTPTKTFDKISAFWNEFPTFIKSLSTLIILIIIGIILANYYLKSLKLPSTNGYYTKDQYNQLVNEKEKLEKKILELESFLSLSKTTIENLQKNLEKKEDKYTEILAEINEKNNRIKYLEKYNKALILGQESFDS